MNKLNVVKLNKNLVPRIPRRDQNPLTQMLFEDLCL